MAALAFTRLLHLRGVLHQPPLSEIRAMPPRAPWSGASDDHIPLQRSSSLPSGLAVEAGQSANQSDPGDDTSKVTTIGGSLYVRQGATCDLPVCTTIGGSLDVSEGATCDLPVCTTIGGSLDVRQGATCDLPVCTTIGGSLEIKPRGRLIAPVLETINGQPLADADDQAALLKQVAEHALADPANLTMNDWHACGTAHCIAGWAVHLTGEEGYALEKKVGPATAGALLLGVDAAAMFFLSKDEATGRLEMIRQGVSA